MQRLSIEALLKKEQAEIYHFVNGLFGVIPSLPSLHIGTDKVAQSDSVMLSTSGPVRVCSYYQESNRKIVVSPAAIRDLVRFEETEGLRINTDDYARRLLA